MSRVLPLFGGLIVGVLWILFSLTLSAISLSISLTIVYFFLAAAGIVPPIDFVPFIPYV
jgi:hypothetical protein